MDLPDASVPPDWGGDTLRRFRYQAEITLPFCLAAAMGDEIVAVIPEHIEDIALDCGSSWRFLQVKSRNLDRGLWTLSQLLEKGGALRSLYRTHLCVRDYPHTLELVLEGAPKSHNLIIELLPGGDKTRLVENVEKGLQIDEDAADSFLNRVVLNEPPAPRDWIAARNRDLIHSHAPHLSKPEVDVFHTRLLEEIERAMRAERIGPLWPRSLVHPERRSSESSERLKLRTLAADHLASLLDSLGATPRPVLRRLVQSGSPTTSPLHRKLLDGGATEEIIFRARNLQANARYEHQVREAQGRPPDEALLADLHERIETHVTARAAMHSSHGAPAVHIWSDLLDLFEARAASIDRGQLLRGDPMLLLGEACDLSDQCRFGWGRASNAP